MDFSFQKRLIDRNGISFYTYSKSVPGKRMTESMLLERDLESPIIRHYGWTLIFCLFNFLYTNIFICIPLSEFFFQFFNQDRNSVLVIGDQPVIGNPEDIGVRVLVDGDDLARGQDSRHMLGGP